MDSWYSHGLMVYSRTYGTDRLHGIDIDLWLDMYSWYRHGLMVWAKTHCMDILMVLSLYLDERRGVQGNTSMRLGEFPRAQPEGTPQNECWYVLYSLTRVKVPKLSNSKSDEALAIAIAIAIAMSRAIAMSKP